jgi:hypothetical protein
MAEIKGANTRPAPIPMRIDATNIKPDAETDKCRSTNDPCTLIVFFIHFNLVPFSPFAIIISNTYILRITQLWPFFRYAKISQNNSSNHHI